MDPNLVENTMNQLNAKNQALNSSSKYGALVKLYRFKAKT
jgi:hypothetical protein